MRHEPGNWCLVTALPPQNPTVVVGLGGKPERLLDASQLKKRPVPVIRRFTGGGTVVVLSLRTGGRQDIWWQSLPMQTVGCIVFVVSHGFGP